MAISSKSKAEQNPQKMLTIPLPQILPFGMDLDSKEMVDEVWQSFVMPYQDLGNAQSAELRMLMAILRSVYTGLEMVEQAEENRSQIIPGSKSVPPGKLKFE